MAQLRRKPVSSSGSKMQNPIAKALSKARHSSFYHDLSLRGENPLRLLGTPKDIWSGSVTAGTQIVSGKIIAGGHVLKNPDNAQNLWSGGEIWKASNLSESWLEYLHSFCWLKDLNQAVDRDGAKRRAEKLIESWIDQNTQWGEISWRVDIVGERISNWLIYTPLILDTDDVIYRGRVLDIMARSARHLMKLSSDLPEGPDALKALIGLILAGLFIPGGDEWYREGVTLLKFTLGKEILADGGIRSRNPQEHLHLYMNLVLLIQSFQQVGRSVPEELKSAVSRMAANLKAISHGDGKLPLFNGTTIHNHEDIYSCLLKSGQNDINLSSLEQSGFARIAKGKTIILFDVGPPAEIEMSRTCHSGTHSFEMSRGSHRLIVNCGDASFIDDTAGYDLRSSSRGSSAHSTLILNDQDSSTIREDGLIGRGVSRMESKTIQEDGHILVESEHDGYVDPYGFLHKRLIYMSETGEDIRGEDIIEQDTSSKSIENIPYSVRFHLHPDISVTLSKAGEMVYLGMTNGETWQFRHRGGLLKVEDSVYFGDAGKISACKQLVLSGGTQGSVTTILWSLKLEGN